MITFVIDAQRVWRVFNDMVLYDMPTLGGDTSFSLGSGDSLLSLGIHRRLYMPCDILSSESARSWLDLLIGKTNK